MEVFGWKGVSGWERRRPGSADVLVGILYKEMEDPTSHPKANEDVGAPGSNEDVGAPGALTPKREWYSRGYLPHRDRIHLLQSITFRLADSLPQSKLKQLELDLKLVPEIRKDMEKRKMIEEWLDAGMGCCALGNAEAAAHVQNSLLHFDGDRYRVLAWVIMPNHVHVLIDPAEPISKIVQAWKSFTARWLLANNDRLGLGVPDSRHVWMREYWDRFIRDDDHLRATINYINQNPVKARLCRVPGDWRWSSAGSADVLVGNREDEADEDVSAPRVGNIDEEADDDVGAPRP